MFVLTGDVLNVISEACMVCAPATSVWLLVTVGDVVNPKTTGSVAPFIFMILLSVAEKLVFKLNLKKMIYK